jgi:hypothetical protein
VGSDRGCNVVLTVLSRCSGNLGKRRCIRWTSCLVAGNGPDRNTGPFSQSLLRPAETLAKFSEQRRY